MAYLSPCMGIRIDCVFGSVANCTRGLRNHQTYSDRSRDHHRFWRDRIYLHGGGQGCFKEKDGQRGYEEDGYLEGPKFYVLQIELK